MTEKLVPALISSAMLLISAGVELVSEENYGLGALLIILGLACAIVALAWALPKAIRRLARLETTASYEVDD